MSCLRYRLVIFYVAIFIALTLLTQVGGAIFVIALLADRWFLPTLQGWRRAAATTAIFVFLYQALSATVVPALAAAGGRIPLPCYPDAGRPFAAGSRWYCILNRHYADARFVALMTELSQAVDRAHPGTITLYLDGNFPFVDGFPLLPHLSHNDGRKLDGVTRSCVPHAVQRVSGALQMRDPGYFLLLARNRDPGSAAHHFVLRCARDTLR